MMPNPPVLPNFKYRKTFAGTQSMQVALAGHFWYSILVHRLDRDILRGKGYKASDT